MNPLAGYRHAEGHPPIALRREQPGDEPLLYDIYASTRAEELALTNWDEALRRAFLTQQFHAMRQGYAGMFPRGEFLIIEADGQPAGRMVVDDAGAVVHVVDLALLPPWQNQGIGTHLMRLVCAQARVPVRLCVIKQNRALRWYHRLGFQHYADRGIYEELEWRPPPSA